jgi:pyruvate,water dikinase
MPKMESEILNNLIKLCYRIFRKQRQIPQEDENLAFREKYAEFTKFLESNTELLKIISDMEVKLEGHEVFGTSYVKSQITRAAFHSMRLVDSFEKMSGKKVPLLTELVDEIGARLSECLELTGETKSQVFVLPYDRVSKEMEYEVGGKSANLGELKSKLGIPVPRGFAITTHAFRAFFDAAGLWNEIAKKKMMLSPDDPGVISQVGEDIQRLISGSEIPGDVAEALEKAHRNLEEETGLGPDGLFVAVRSSAVGEDSELSFAGQYATVLNVPAGGLVEAYKAVLTSLYTPRAISYRYITGVVSEQTAMGAACLEMVRARVSGVLFTRHPLHPASDTLLINALWGLGPYVVDGVLSPDSFEVARDGSGRIVSRTIADKNRKLAPAPEGGTREEPVFPPESTSPCLDDAAIQRLTEYALRIEEHYGAPQDIEWAIDGEGSIRILQARPLVLKDTDEARRIAGPEPGYEVLIEGGVTAMPGTGCGPVFLAEDDEEDFSDFPEGGVLVAAHSSPRFMVVMRKAQAIATDFGSVTGHMAALSREFGVPTVLSMKTVTKALMPGETVTVDAHAGRVYRGRVEKILGERPRPAPVMKSTPVYQLLKRAAGHIVPLNLVNPKSPGFSPRHCATIHDVMRYLHEKSYEEMFSLGDKVSGLGGAAKLNARLGLDAHIIDLGDGLVRGREDAGDVGIEDIQSRPLAALLSGMVLSQGERPQVRPVDMQGFLSVLSEQVLASPKGPGGERFGEKSFAIVSDKYLNFSSRVGYHYAILDCFCGATINKNYITFAFKGGAADPVRRNRRVRAIAMVLSRMGFTVAVTGDRVDARFQKMEPDEIEQKLVILGKLLQITRQMDMLMSSEASVAAFAEKFLSGGYDRGGASRERG